jgi:uncharacterized lipoprotein YddW (UPF0748 family)
MKRSKAFPVQVVLLCCAVWMVESCARPKKPAAATAATGPQPVGRPAQPAELRGMWVSDTPKLDWDSATANMRRAGFNTMYVNLLTGGAAFYPASRVLPSVAAAGEHDPVARGIELARRRGLSVHAKQIVMFMFKTPPEFQRQMVAAGRVMRGPQGQPVLQAGFAWLCPSQAANRAMATAALAEALGRYAVDGVQFDYIRFSEQPSCYCGHCRQQFERSVGGRLAQWPATVVSGPYAERFAEWRRQLITDWVRDLAAQARRVRPGIAVSAAVFQDLDDARQRKMQDWKRWLELGLLDYVCTMTYTTDAAEFEARLRKQLAWAQNRAQVVAGIGSWKLQRMEQLWAQISASRRLGAPGFVLFSYDDAAARGFWPDLNASTARN